MRGTVQRSAGRQAWGHRSKGGRGESRSASDPVYVCARVHVRLCVRRPRPTHTAQRPSHIHTYVSTHTSLSFQNTQHLYKTAKQKKKVPNKTLQTSFSVTSKSLIAVSSALHSWNITPSNQAGHYSTAHIVQEKHLFPPGVNISGNVSER